MPTVLIKPNAKKKQYGKVVHLSAIEPPVWLALLAKRYPSSRIIDMEAENMDEGDLIKALSAIDVERCVILATGSHPSAHIQQTEAAEKVKAAVSSLGNVPVEIFDHLPFNPVEMGAIDWALLPLEKYRAHNWHAWGRKDKTYGATFASISCPFTCEFCCVKDFYKSSYQQRAPELVVEDIRSAVRRGVTNFKMMDELFAVDNKGVHAVCDLLAASGLGKEINIWAYARIDTVNALLLKKLRAAGVCWLAYGIESGNEEIRRSIVKGKFDNQKIRDVIQMTKDADINIVGNYMFGFWDDTQATMRETLDFAKELNCEYANLYCVTVYKGSKLYDDMKARGVDLPERGDEFAQMSPAFKPVPTKYLSGRDVLRLRDAAFNEYFGNEAYLSMMCARFGKPVVEEIRSMLSINIREKV
ncbi:MAG: radical SAM protein [Candidatus Omnitrophica bacterium]|nr:radical SAM protein [Candidatus Omnitrophota bacterium]